MYIVERICMFYYYQSPPSYDDKLSRAVLSLLNKAPIGMFALGYWALGNRQIFFNDPQEMIFSNKEGDPKHELFSSGVHVILCLLLFVMIVGFHFFRKLWSLAKYFCSCCFKEETQSTDICNDEKLPKFWEALKGDD